VVGGTEGTRLINCETASTTFEGAKLGNPDGECGHWEHSQQPCCYYDKQGRLTYIYLCHLKLTQIPSEV